MVLKVIDNIAEMQSLAEEWNNLANHFKTPLLSSEWFIACAEAFCQPDRLRIIVSISGTELNGIAPIVLMKNRGLISLQLLGSFFLGELSGLIYRDEESLEEVIYGIMNFKLPIILNRLRLDSREVYVLQNTDRKRAFVRLKNSMGSPYVPIETSWDQFEANLSSRRRYDLRRACKRAKDLGDVQFEIVSPNIDTLDDYFEEMVRVEAAGWKRREGTALLCNERLRLFFYLYSKAVARNGMLRLCFLRIGNKSAAALLAVCCFKRFWVLKIGYDEAFSRCSPGILLIHETIRYAFVNGLESYEFLGSDDPWIQMWTQQKKSYVTVKIYPFSVRGQVSYAIDITSDVMKKILKSGDNI